MRRGQGHAESNPFPSTAVVDVPPNDREEKRRWHWSGFGKRAERGRDSQGHEWLPNLLIRFFVSNPLLKDQGSRSHHVAKDDCSA